MKKSIKNIWWNHSNLPQDVASLTALQFWKQDYHPIELDTPKKTQQRLDYLHENPVRSGLVWEPWHYKYSSAIDNYTNEHGLIERKLRMNCFLCHEARRKMYFISDVIFRRCWVRHEWITWKCLFNAIQKMVVGPPHTPCRRSL